MRLDGQRIKHGHTQAQIGSIITMPRGNDVIVFELLHIPNRRGPAREAAGHYNLINI